MLEVFFCIPGVRSWVLWFFFEVMFNIKDFMQGKKTLVEGPKKNPVGRPKSRPKGIKDVILEEIPDIQQQLEGLKKPLKAVVEVEGSSSDVEVLEVLADAPAAAIEVDSDGSEPHSLVTSSDSGDERVNLEDNDSESDDEFFLSSRGNTCWNNCLGV